MRRPGLVAGRFLFSYYFYFNELRETKMPSLLDLFLAGKGFGLFGFACLVFEFGGFQGLTCDFWAENAEKYKDKGNRSVASPFGLRSGLRQSGGPKGWL
jgi:hypothetical protein